MVEWVWASAAWREQAGELGTGGLEILAAPGWAGVVSEVCLGCGCLVGYERSVIVTCACLRPACAAHAVEHENLLKLLFKVPRAPFRLRTSTKELHRRRHHTPRKIIA